MLSAARLPQVWAEACISLQTSWEQVNSSNCPNHVRRTKSSIKKRIIVCRTVRSMFGEQTFAQLVSKRTSVRFCFGSPFSANVMVCGHRLVSLSITINRALKWLALLPIWMQESCRWLCSLKYSLPLASSPRISNPANSTSETSRR